MAILPIRLGRSAQPQIGGPLSTPNTAAGAGLQQLGASIADAGIEGAKRQTKARKIKRESELLEMQSEWQIRMDKGVKELANKETDSATLQTQIEELNNYLIKDVIKNDPTIADDSAPIEGLMEKMKDRTLQDFTRYRISANNFAAHEVGLMTARRIEDTVDNYAEMTSESPDLLVGHLRVAENYIDAIVAENKNVSTSAEAELRSGVKNRLSVIAIDSMSKQGPQEAFDAKDMLQGDEMAYLPVKMKEQLLNSVNQQITYYQQSAVGGAKALSTNQRALIDDGEVLPNTFEANRAKLELSKVPAQQINELEAEYVDAQKTAYQVNLFHNQPDVEIENAIRRGQSELRHAKTPEAKARISANNAIMENAGNRVIAENKNDPHKAAMRSEPAKALFDQRKAIAEALQENPENEELRTQMYASGENLAQLLNQMSVHKYGIPDQIPFLSKENISEFQSVLNSSEVSPQEKIAKLHDKLLSFGPNYENDVSKALFNGPEMVPMNYISSMADPSIQVNTLVAHQNYAKNLEKLDKLAVAGTPKPSALIAVDVEEYMEDFVATFPYADSDDTAIGGNRLVTEVAMDLMANQGMDQYTAIQKGMQMVTGQYDAYRGLRIPTNHAGKKFIKFGLDAITGNALTSASVHQKSFAFVIASASGKYRQFPSDAKNEIFKNAPISVVTDPKTGGALLKYGSGPMDFVSLPDGSNLVLDMRDLDALGSIVSGGEGRVVTGSGFERQEKVTEMIRSKFLQAQIRVDMAKEALNRGVK